MSPKWTRELPTSPGVFDYRNLTNADGRAPIPERVMWVGYVNWTEDPQKGHGTKPTEYMPRTLRAVSIHRALTADSLTVQEWGGEWRRIDGEEAKLYERAPAHGVKVGGNG